jgi:uncharacterized membrane protein YhaH (DUF805 family)
MFEHKIVKVVKDKITWVCKNCNSFIVSDMDNGGKKSTCPSCGISAIYPNFDDCWGKFYKNSPLEFMFFTRRTSRNTHRKTFVICYSIICACLALFFYYPNAVTQALLMTSIYLGGLILLISVVRRFHDLGMSAMVIFGYLIPFLNLYLLYLEFFREGEEKFNKWGPAPNLIKSSLSSNKQLIDSDKLNF